jgi:glycosyltransferase involved in cell wall biosynthesis
MARILWHGISPYQRTGYGVQARLFAPLIAALGHRVAVAQMGPPHPADSHGEFDGIPVIGPSAAGEYRLPPDRDIRAALGGNPDLIVTLKDPYVLPAGQYRGRNVASLCPVDCHPMSVQDRRWFAASGAVPVAISRDGQARIRDAGFDPLFAPHGVDTAFWVPGDQGEARDLLGLPRGMFIAGINAMNLGQPSRKAFYEQLAGFAGFHVKHPGALLLAHTNPDQPDGTALRPIARQLGIEDAVIFGRDMLQSETQMRTWYRSLDVLLNATYGEGFGIPAAEAVCCRVPVIGTDCSALTENIPPGAGWLVKGQPLWVPAHEASWTAPSIPGITGALEKALRTRLHPAPGLAAQWDAQAIITRYWKPLIEELT